MILSPARVLTQIIIITVISMFMSELTAHWSHIILCSSEVRADVDGFIFLGQFVADTFVF